MGRTPKTASTAREYRWLSCSMDPFRAGAQVYKKFLTTHQKVRLYEQDTQYCTYLISTAVLVPADRWKLRLARSTV